MSFLQSPSVAPPSSLRPSSTEGSCSYQCFLHIQAAGWSCPTQTGHWEGAGDNKAPWDNNCSQIEIECHLITVSWCYKFVVEGPVVPLSAKALALPR